MHRAGFLQQCFFGEHAIDGAAHCACHGCCRYTSVRPVLEETSGDPVPDFESGDVVTDGDYLARTVRVRDERINDTARGRIFDG